MGVDLSESSLVEQESRGRDACTWRMLAGDRRVGLGAFQLQSGEGPINMGLWLGNFGSVEVSDKAALDFSDSRFSIQV